MALYQREVGGTGRRERRRKQLPFYFKEKRRYLYLKEEALDHDGWRTGCEKGYGPSIRPTTW